AEIKTKKGILVEPMDHPEDHLLRTIEHGGIVGRWLGRSEFGPRALGHRSILLRADDQSLVDTLNARLKREEFMPFAPIRRAGAGSSTMTVVVPADDELRDRCPAAVHRDGTVRTQLINAEFDPGLWRLLARAEEAGLPALINTSFNRHGEPIVERPSEAVELLRLGVVDVLQCDKFLVRRV
ncbi:MAG: carbamoyltransferase, partial [Myxococcota bacterium]